MKTTRLLVAALVVWLLQPAVATRQAVAPAQQGQSYEELLGEYRTGNADAAVRALARWPVARVHDLLKTGGLLPVAPGSGGLSPESSMAIASVVMLHTEAVLLGAPTDEHLAVIRRAMAPLTIRVDARPFLVSWRIVMASYLLAVGRTADAEVVAGLAEDNPEILLLLGAVSEGAARRRGPVPVSLRAVTSDSMREDAWVRIAAAEEYYRAALKRDPSLLEARVRLGRVVALRGRRDEALIVLAEARTKSGDDGFLGYLAALFLGGVNEDLGRVDAAAKCYNAAIKAYPEAQTAYVALGHLLEGDGRIEEAWATVSRMFSQAGNPARDPWWVYDSAQSWQIGHRVELLRAACRK